jgi:hypothetical protein
MIPHSQPPHSTPSQTLLICKGHTVLVLRLQTHAVTAGLYRSSGVVVAAQLSAVSMRYLHYISSRKAETMSSPITSVTFPLPAPLTPPQSPTVLLQFPRAIYFISLNCPLTIHWDFYSARGQDKKPLQLITNKGIAAPGNTGSVVGCRRHILHPSSGLNLEVQKLCSIIQVVRKGGHSGPSGGKI